MTAARERHMPAIKKRTAVIISLLIVLAVSGCVSYKISSADMAEKAAGEWVNESPTFKFDGSGLTLLSYNVNKAQKTYEFSYSFVSAHGGYGDRTGQPVTQAITPHTIDVTVKDRTVISAIIDGIWDELNQRMILRLQPMQCELTPWQEWYANGSIQFFKAPTEKDVAVAYYSMQHNIELKDLQQISTGPVCLACHVCPQDHFFTAEVDEKNITKMVELGWLLGET